ncbi:MAG: hypothetical protein KBF98_06120 [Rhodoferax sp.]|nr:hypothetical protein [Rhodoferax sp.]MBP9059870.1 hypothetical protein [Rhodoferax sp.]MBP9683054.1 hypothetical protein [Rhodoferax sp.]
MFVILLQMALLLGGWGAAQAVVFDGGGNHTVAVKSDSSLWAWGGGYGFTPKQIGIGFRTVSAGLMHTAAVKNDGSLWAWGDNSFGQLGDGTYTDSAAPKQIGTGFSTVAAGVFHTLALKSDGSLWAWGNNEWGQLGDGSRTNSSTPKQIGTGFYSLAPGSNHTVAIKNDGSLWAWGGDPGDGHSSYTTPMQIGTGFSSVASGQNFSVAVKNDGSVWAWGDNSFGALGNGTRTSSSTPQMIGTGYSSVATGADHTVALKTDGSLWAWGYNSYGELGDGTTTHSLTPKQVGTGFAAVAAGDWYTLALKSDGSLLAWGDNVAGQLGDATSAARSTPVLVTNETANGPLDLSPEDPNSVPADKIPPYWLQVTKAADVSTAITYNNDDLNKVGSVYVVAYLDPASPLLAGSIALPRAVKAAAGTSSPVPAVLTRSGWKQMSSATPTEPLYSGPLIPSKSTFSMYEASKFDQKYDRGLFCVAYAGANSAKGLIRSVVSGAVEANLKDCPPLQINSTVDTLAPSQPTSVSATALATGQVKLSWSSSADNVGVAYYNIYRGNTLIAQLGNVTSYSDTSSQASLALGYSVVACDEALNCSGKSTNTRSAQSDCLFGWAERSYPQYFAPAGAQSARFNETPTLPTYYFRYYAGTGNYLATSSADNQLWAVGKATAGNLLDVGPLTNFTGTAGCQ